MKFMEEIRQQFGYERQQEESVSEWKIHFKPLKTIPIVCVLMATSLGMTQAGLLLERIGLSQSNSCNGYYGMLYIRSIFWVMVYFGHWMLKLQHKRLKTDGYASFLKKTHSYNHTPLQIVSYCNVIILTVHTILLQIFRDELFDDCSVDGFSLFVAVNMICLLECAVLTPIFLAYIVQVQIFNNLQLPPDVMIPVDDQIVLHRGSFEIDPRELLRRQQEKLKQREEDNRKLREQIDDCKRNRRNQPQSSGSLPSTSAN
ncbi:uncharacterized protein LOC129739914 [Uranotaenia lowii]|uniref:uncharacterized protein LOC129739914 n=1 Tax=Uranotaenia lowii TaxID=190385 RepID=UPI0024784D08|nr:uncharacterized protein LOC129739914 [Uranotaenia lowii]